MKNSEHYGQISIRLYGEEWREFQRWMKATKQKKGALAKVIISYFCSVSPEEKSKILRYELEQRLSRLNG